MILVAFLSIRAIAAEPPALTSLSDTDVRYEVPKRPYVVLKRADLEAVVVDNRAVDDDVLPGHRAGYSGIASLKHAKQRENLFVPSYAGLNLEHIHDGTTQPPKILYEPRYVPMELRVIGPSIVELYQKPTPTYGLESCARYELLEDGAIEMTFECIPRRRSFKNNYIGLFWASYIRQPESIDIHFKGRDADQPADPRWIRGVTPESGRFSTHLGADDRREFVHDPDFPLKLVFNYSPYRYSKPWYYGVSNGMALVYVFRPQDQIRLTQSPYGGGSGNPAWDFQFFIPDYEVGKRYQMVMRTLYLPYESPEQIERAVERHRRF
ncbi:MAG: hypothetical protein GX594_04550 [Pirellulaceae bacterium]|nr:hypothetical protein [Pirellulaceae bacterium]